MTKFEQLVEFKVQWFAIRLVHMAGEPKWPRHGPFNSLLWVCTGFNGQKPENPHSLNLHEHEISKSMIAFFCWTYQLMAIDKQQQKWGNLSFVLVLLTQRPERANEQLHICYWILNNFIIFLKINIVITII